MNDEAPLGAEGEGESMAKAMYVRFEVPKELINQLYEVVEIARDSENGKIAKGSNEVTKVVERGHARFVVMAEDVVPPEVLAHMPMLCDEKEIPYGYVPSKQELGSAAGLSVSTSAVAVVKAGKARARIDDLSGKLGKVKD
jgi:large subunit ribosomal protein L7Ae